MKKLLIILTSIAALGTMFGIYSSVSANPLFFPATVQTATATSSPSYMTAGTATTTLQYDSYSANTYTGAPTAALLVQYVASSTSSVFNTNIEYSQDGIDWYQEGGTNASGFATTSKPYDISQVMQYKYTWNGTQAGLPTTVLTSGTTTRMISLNIPTRFVRAVFSMPAGSAAGAVWAQIVPIKQRAESK